MGVPKNTKELREHIDEYVRLKLRIEQMENAMASLNKIASLQDGVWLMELSDTVKEHRDEAIVEAGEMYLEIVTAIMHGVKEGIRMTIRDALDHYHEVECECDRCHNSHYTHEFHMLDNYIDPVRELCDCLRSDGWIVTDDEEFICPDCQEQTEGDDSQTNLDDWED